VVDLEACRIQMPRRIAELLAEGKSGAGTELVAAAADVDPKTIRTFLDGGRVRPETLIAIVERGLGLKFGDVVKPAKVA